MRAMHHPSIGPIHGSPPLRTRTSVRDIVRYSAILGVSVLALSCSDDGPTAPVKEDSPWVPSVYIGSSEAVDSWASLSALPRVDQSQLDGSEQNQAIHSTRSVGQSFTVGATGLLAGLELSVFRGIGATDLVVEILDNTDGDPRSAPLLGSVSVPPSGVGPAPTSLVNESITGTLIDLSPLGIQVEIGDVLALRLRTTSLLPSLWGLRTSVFTDRYPGGRYFVIYPGGPLSWTSGDAAFKTFVESTIQVTIDIKPGSDQNSILCQDNLGVLSVAMLTTKDLDATAVDHTTVTFEGASETHINLKTGEPRRHEEDVDGDGDVDLVFHFRLGDTGLDCFSDDGTLRGETYDGIPVEGTDAVRMRTRIRGAASCPFEPKAIFLTGADAVAIRVQLTAPNQFLNWASDDPPGVDWAFKEPDGTVLESREEDDYWSSTTYGAGFYDLVFQSDLAGTTYPDIQVNVACEYEAPQPDRW